MNSLKEGFNKVKVTITGEEKEELSLENLDALCPNVRAPSRFSLYSSIVKKKTKKRSFVTTAYVQTTNDGLGRMYWNCNSSCSHFNSESSQIGRLTREIRGSVYLMQCLSSRVHILFDRSQSTMSCDV